MLTTLARVKAELKASGTVTADDAVLTGYINRVTQRVRELSWNFEPVYDTEYFSATPQRVAVWDGTLELKNRKGQRLLLAGGSDTPTVTSDAQSLVWNTDVLPDPRGLTPIRALRLNDASNALNQTWYPTGRTFIETVVIAGFWGYRENYATDGWPDSLQTVQDNPLSASATTVTVTNVGAADSLFRTPVFSAGNLIRIESELLQVYATSTVANTLSVRRGANGTTAAQHAKNTAISIWEPEPDIVDECTRQVCLWYARRGSFEQVTVAGVATAVYPRDLQAGLYAALQGYENQ